MIRNCLLGLCLLLLHTLPASAADCPDNPSSYDDMKKCKIGTWKVKPEDIEKMRRKGIDPPLTWKPCGSTENDKEAKGCINSGGLGNMGMTALKEPGQIPSDSAPGAGGGGGGGPGPGPGDGSDDGDGGSQCPAPEFITPDGCVLKGKREPIESSTKEYPCGATIELAATSITTTATANAALIATQGDPTLYAYVISGKDLSYRTKSTIPDFYCEIQQKLDAQGRPEIDPLTGQPILIAAKIPVTISDQYISINNNTKTASISIEESPLTILMTRNGGTSLNLTPPPPNPGYFTAQGAQDVDPQCRREEDLLSALPADFGDIRYKDVGGGSGGNCTVTNEFPGGKDPENCIDFVQYMNTQYTNVYIGPNQSFSVGRISGGGAFSTNTLQTQGGAFVLDPQSGELTYEGTSLLTQGGTTVNLGIVNPINEQAFLNGGAFILNDTYTLYLNPPGRIKLGANGVMQLIDGGTIEISATGQTIRVIAPMGSVQFPTGELITGSTFGAIKASENQLLPTQPDGGVQNPYDATLDQKCPEPTPPPPAPAPQP